jgi:hypothetical protein
MMSLPRTFFAPALAAACLLLPTVARAQTDVVLYGRVIGSDHASAPPPTWTVTVTSEFTDATIGQTRKSQNDIYAYRIATGKTARLVFQASGYRPGKGEWVSESADTRMRPDIVLEKYETQMSWLSSAKPDDVQKDLAEQAELARRTGTNDIFLANFAIQKKILSKQPSYAAAVENFEKANTSYREIMKVSQDREIDPFMIAFLVDDDRTNQTKYSAADLYGFARKSNVAPELRARAIDRLAVLPRPAGLETNLLQSLLETLRTGSASDDWSLRISSIGALYQLGTAADKAAIAKELSTQPTMRFAEVAAANSQSKGTTETDTDAALARVAATATNPSVRVEAVRGVSDTPSTPAVKDLLTVLKDTSTPAAARIEAVRALEGVKEKNASGEVQDALKTAAIADPSPDVRRTAAGVAAAAASSAATGGARKP